MTTRNVSWAYMKVGLQHAPFTESLLSHDVIAAMPCWLISPLGKALFLCQKFPVAWKHQSGRCGNARLLDRIRNTYVKPSCQGFRSQASLVPRAREYSVSGDGTRRS